MPFLWAHPGVVGGGAFFGSNATMLAQPNTLDPVPSAFLMSQYPGLEGGSVGPGPPPDSQASFDAQVAALGPNLIIGWAGQSQADVTDANGIGATLADREAQGAACNLTPGSPRTNASCFSNNNGESGTECFPMLVSTKNYEYIQANGGYGARARQWIPYGVNPIYESSDAIRFAGVDVRADFPANLFLWVIATFDGTARSSKVPITSSALDGSDTVVTATGLNCPNTSITAYTARRTYDDDKSDFYTPAYSTVKKGVVVPFTTDQGGANSKLGEGVAMSPPVQNVGMWSFRYEFELDPSNWHVPNSGSASRKLWRLKCEKQGGFNEDNWVTYRCLLYNDTIWTIYPLFSDIGFGIPGYEAPDLQYDIPVSMANQRIRGVWNVYFDRVEWSLKNLTTDTLLVDNAVVTAVSQGWESFTRRSIELEFTNGGAGNGYDPGGRNKITGNTSGATAILLRFQDTIDSGTWAGGDAAGRLWIRTKKGPPFTPGETVTINAPDDGPIQTTNGFTVTADPGVLVDQNYITKLGFIHHKSGSSLNDPAHPDVMETVISHVITGSAPMGID